MKVCGNCLHDRDAHEPFNHNQHFMYCGVCNNLCDNEEYDKEHKPSSFEQVVELQAKREYSPYKPKELKQMEKKE